MGRKIAWIVAGMLGCAVAAQAHPAAEGSFRSKTQRLTARAERQAQDTVRKARGTLRREAVLCMDDPFYDFGDVLRRGGDLVHDFAIRNEGSVPLVITRVVTSCSCLKAVFSKRPLAPGEEGVIRIVYEPHKSESGTFHKVIQVYSNSSGGRQVITVQGNSLDPKKM